jgi:hypothetical protein
MQQPITQSRLAMINMGDNAEISYVLGIHGYLVAQRPGSIRPLAFSGNISGGQDNALAPERKGISPNSGQNQTPRLEQAVAGWSIRSLTAALADELFNPLEHSLFTQYFH